jgi:hypothetical protein
MFKLQIRPRRLKNNFGFLNILSGSAGEKFFNLIFQFRKKSIIAILIKINYLFQKFKIFSVYSGKSFSVDFFRKCDTIRAMLIKN